MESSTLTNQSFYSVPALFNAGRIVIRVFFSIILTLVSDFCSANLCLQDFYKVSYSVFVRNIEIILCIYSNFIERAIYLYYKMHFVRR